MFILSKAPALKIKNYKSAYLYKVHSMSDITI